MVGVVSHDSIHTLFEDVLFHKSRSARNTAVLTYLLVDNSTVFSSDLCSMREARVGGHKRFVNEHE